jgi:hypothetical protein
MISLLGRFLLPASERANIHDPDTKEERPKMANFVITGKAEQTDESSYIMQSTGEVVTKNQLTLNVPGMNDRVLCEMPLDVSPKSDMLEQWEMEETWLVVSASTMRALGFTRSNARPGEKAVGALVIFQAIDVREATADERRALMEAQGQQAPGQAAPRRSQGRARRHQGSREAVCLDDP